MYAIFAAIIFTSLTVLNLLIIFGAPLGEFTMGGKYKILPPEMKIPAIISLCTQIFAIIIVLQAGGIINLWFSNNVTRIICYVYSGYLIINTFMNLISKSKKEKYIMTPLSLVSALLFFITAFKM